MSSATKETKGPALYKHWKRPHTRMYDYNYQVAESYYKPQVQYAGYIAGPGPEGKGRKIRRRSVSPPPPQSFLERWAANPFYGKEMDSIDLERESLVRARNRARSMTRASSIPNLGPRYFDEEEELRQRQLRSTASRARSILSYDDGDFKGNYDDYVNLRHSRARSVSTVRPFDDADVEWEWERDREFDHLVRLADKGEREKSVFNMRMALDPNFNKQLMTTTLSHGLYKNSLYGTETWDPSTYLMGRQ